MFVRTVRRFSVVLALGLLLALVALPVAAVSNVTIGPVMDTFMVGDTCSYDSSVLFGMDISFVPDGVDELVSDPVLPPQGTAGAVAGGSDVLAFVLHDALGNLLDFTIGAYPTDTTSHVEFVYLSIVFNQPLARPFYVDVYDLVGQIPLDVYQSVSSVYSAMYIKENGILLAESSFDPAEFFEECANLPVMEVATEVADLVLPPELPACLLLPPGSVVGDLPLGSQAYYAPGQQANGVVLNPGTYWVIGMDASRAYYKVALACNYVWVPVETMQPSFQAPWNGQPLPDRVVS